MNMAWGGLKCITTRNQAAVPFSLRGWRQNGNRTIVDLFPQETHPEEGFDFWCRLFDREKALTQ